MVHQRPARHTAGVAALLALTVAAAGCAPIPASAPKYVTDFRAGDAAESASQQAGPTGPEWKAPQKDPLSWRDCSDQLATRYGTPPAANATLECANFTVRLGDSGTPMQLSVTRAELPGTPDTAAPLVLVGGTEFTGQRALATLAAGESPMLANRRVVAVERRGVGASSPLNCRNTEQRGVLRSGAEEPKQPFDERVKKVGEQAQAAATACGDAYPGTIEEYTGAAAADDLEALRTAWDVPALGLFAVGDGSTTALAYAAQHPKQVARLVLDSPVRYAASELQRAEDAAKGTSAAVDAFASQCGPACALGADPAAAVRDIVDRSARGDLGPFTDTDVRRALIMTLGIGPGDRDARIARLATALQGARTGDAGPLRSLLRTADDALGSDGQFVARCSDAVQKASPDQVKASAQKWGPQYRLGAATALALTDCTGWPTMEAPPALEPLEVRSVVTTSAADPLTSRDALETLTGKLTVAGARPSTLSWGGIGDGAAIRSTCVQKALTTYLDRQEAPSARACPA
ncbi:alpha/beta fold hydrolase [Tsukamurella sp. 1534]|uniref:alpha/beta fold hydrolase n=1 Tax=Tsukamurella sp. 1534 TaxID=1151061 RepID=UPI0011D2396E|nr:alpha/beta fold hydrolase [Tsukamurella sp. 1534]